MKNLDKVEKDILENIKARLLADFEYFKNRKVVYLDYPVHNNIGDHLIYWGAMEALRINGNKILAQFWVDNYDLNTVKRFVEKHNAIIICHGGGNFGDIYDKHQDFRLSVVNDFSETEIIMFPQSVFYESQAKQNHDLSAISKANVSVHVRDQESLMMLQEAGIDVKLTPDCAHTLSGTSLLKTDNSTSPQATLVFRRKDIEAVEGLSSGFDWVDIISKRDKLIYKAIRKLAKFKSLHYLSVLLFKLYSKNLIRKAVKTFSQYDCIDTDRLHGFLLAILINKSVKHLDNTYKKIERYKLTWITPDN